MVATNQNINYDNFHDYEIYEIININKKIVFGLKKADKTVSLEANDIFFAEINQWSTQNIVLDAVIRFIKQDEHEEIADLMQITKEYRNSHKFEESIKYLVENNYKLLEITPSCGAEVNIIAGQFNIRYI